MKKKITIVSVLIIILGIVIYGLFKTDSLPYYVESNVIPKQKDDATFPADVITGSVKGDINQIRSMEDATTENAYDLSNMGTPQVDLSAQLEDENAYIGPEDDLNDFDSNIIPPKIDEKTLHQLEKENKHDTQGDISDHEIYGHASKKIHYNAHNMQASNKNSQMIPSHIPNKKGIKHIAILVDSMGANASITKNVIDMKYKLNLGFIPYMRQVKSQVSYAIKHNKTIVLQMAMQPLNSNIKLNSNALLVTDSKSQLLRKISWNLSQFQGYSAVTTYMGSRFVQDTSKLHILMSELKQKNLSFVDALTTVKSKAYAIAIAQKIPTLKRNVFINTNHSYHKTLTDFTKITSMANEYGYALAIVHPSTTTVKALKVWLHALAKHKDYQLVTISQLIHDIYTNHPEDVLKIITH